MELRTGYRQTEVDVIPDDWDAVQLVELIAVQGGIAFSSDHFGKKGPILLTPGNFSLDGGLFFDERNTKRFSGYYPNSAVLEHGDLLIVMTDLTPDCNLLGKPAFVQLNEPILHNQRIGKIIFRSKRLSPQYLYWYFLTQAHAKRMKETATGSTVRHTSNGSILASTIILPKTQEEQYAIAAALSDADALIASLDALIAKKRDLKQAALQQLLTGKTRLPGFEIKPGYKETDLGPIPTDWEIARIEDVLSITTGSRNTQDRIDDGAFPFFVRSQTIERIDSYAFDGEAVLTAGDGVGTGKVFHYINGKFDLHQRVYMMSNFSGRLVGYYFYLFFSNYFYDRIISMTAKSSVDSVRREMIANMLLPLPCPAEQSAIATALSEMEAEIEILEAKRNKAHALRQGMMQELLTGRIRLL